MTDSILSKDELAQIDKELESLKNAVGNDAVAKAKEQGRMEAFKEAEIQKKLDEKEKRLEELEKSLSAQRELSEKSIKDMQDKINSFATSKAPANIKDPFAERGERAEGFNPDKLSDEEIRKIEEESARAFFGPDYDRMKRDFSGN